MGRSVKRMMDARDAEYENMLMALRSLTPYSVVMITDKAILIDGFVAARKDLLSREMWNEALEFLKQEVKPTGQPEPTGLNHAPQKKVTCIAPQLGERILLLILSKGERVNIPGDLEEEFKRVAAKHGARYAKLWYYKQVAASTWPMIRKAVGWGLLASIGAWIRRII